MISPRLLKVTLECSRHTLHDTYFVQISIIPSSYSSFARMFPPSVLLVINTSVIQTIPKGASFTNQLTNFLPSSRAFVYFLRRHKFATGYSQTYTPHSTRNIKQTLTSPPSCFHFTGSFTDRWENRTSNCLAQVCPVFGTTGLSNGNARFQRTFIQWRAEIFASAAKGAIRWIWLPVSVYVCVCLCVCVCVHRGLSDSHIFRHSAGQTVGY